MSAFQHLATPAPKVEAAVADRVDATDDDTYKVEPASASGTPAVAPAPNVEPAVTFDNPHQFAPPISAEVASHLSVAALRGGSGAEFESKAAVIRGGVQRNFLRRTLPCIFDERDFISYGEVARFVFVKGNCIFVYGDSTDPCPLYAIPMETVVATQEDPNNPDKDSFTISPRGYSKGPREGLVTVLLKDNLTGKLAYQVTFDTASDRGLAKRFLDTVWRNTKYYSGEVSASVVRDDATDKVVPK